MSRRQKTWVLCLVWTAAALFSLSFSCSLSPKCPAPLSLSQFFPHHNRRLPPPSPPPATPSSVYEIPLNSALYSWCADLAKRHPRQLINVACSEQGQGGSNSSISSYIPFLFLIASVIGLLQVKDLFETHPSNMWISVAALTIFCFSHAAKKKMIINWAQLIDTLRVLSAALAGASLLSVLLPDRLCYLPFLLGLVLAASILAYPGFIKGFHSVINISKRLRQRTTVEPDGLPV